MTAALNVSLEALLFKKRLRDAFVAGDASGLDVSTEDLEALRAIDARQLEAAATLAREHVMTRSHRGSGRLVDAYSATLAAWQHDNPGTPLAELASDFLESSAFDAYRAHPFAGQGICLEEAFYRFVEQADIGDASARLREFAMAILRALAAVPAPAFDVPALLRRAPKGYYAVLPRGPTLVAVLDGTFVEGVIPCYLAALLEGRPNAALAEAPAAIVDELVGLGLLEAVPRSTALRR